MQATNQRLLQGIPLYRSRETVGAGEGADGGGKAVAC